MWIVIYFSVVVLLGSAAAHTQEVSWLGEVTQPPAAIPQPARPLTGILVDASGRRIESWAAWESRRAELMSLWKSELGEMPERPSDCSFTVLHREELDWGTRELIEYAGEPGSPVQAYLLRPAVRNEDSGAGVVALHPTTALTIDAIAGVSGQPSQYTGVALTKEGFIVLCPRCFLWQDVETLGDAVARHQTRHPGTTGMAKMLYDAQRAVDILAALPEVDDERIGAFGHSLGAKEVLYLMAFDTRVRAGVASEGGVALDSTNWDAAWYLGERARDPNWPRDHHELLALTVPRPLLLIGGESGPGAADGTRSWPLIDAAHAVSDLAEPPRRLGLLNHGQGHSLPDQVLSRAVEWLSTYLVKAVR